MSDRAMVAVLLAVAAIAGLVVALVLPGIGPDEPCQHDRVGCVAP